MQNYLSVQERNSKLERPKQDLSKPESVSTQLEASLWLERSLNQLGDCLNNCLSSHSAQNQTTELDELFRTLVTQLNLMLDSGVAIAVPNSSRLLSQLELDFKVCYSAPEKLACLDDSTVAVLNTGKISLQLKAAITLQDLKQLQLQQPQIAWPLLDCQNTVAWLIIPNLTKPPITELEAHKALLKPQLVERSLQATANVLAQHKRIQAISLQCQQLEICNRELLRTNQLKSEFLANTSHEIRTPLSSILGFTHLLLAQGYSPDNLRHQEYLNIILSSGQHLLALINDILDLSKIAANQLEINWETVNVPELCRSVLTLVKEKASDKGLKLRLEIDPSVTTLNADSLRLKQMLFNLLSNALKFTNQGTVGLQVKYRNLSLHFTVWDTGTGISPEQQSQLFQPYSQIANVVAGQQEGTGLGLALTQKLAELHGGRIEVESELNHGSRFTIVLPLIALQVNVTPSRVATVPNIIKAVNPPPLSTMVAIMVVEDNLHNAKLITTYLGKLGYQVTWVKNGTQMWEALKQSIPELILMDVHLPDVDGLTLLQQLQTKKQYQKIPVIVQTAMAMKGDRETCLAAGAIEYISKPIDLKTLAILVSKYGKPTQ